MNKGTLRNLEEKVTGRIEEKVSEYLKVDGENKSVEEDLVRLLTIYSFCSECHMREVQSEFYSGMTKMVSDVDISKLDRKKIQDMVAGRFMKGGN